MIQYVYRSREVVVSSLPDKRGELPAFSIRTRRRIGWLADAVVLSAREAREIAFAILRATFHAVQS